MAKADGEFPQEHSPSSGRFSSPNSAAPTEREIPANARGTVDPFSSPWSIVVFFAAALRCDADICLILNVCLATIEFPDIMPLQRVAFYSICSCKPGYSEVRCHRAISIGKSMFN